MIVLVYLFALLNPVFFLNAIAHWHKKDEILSVPLVLTCIGNVIVVSALSAML